MQYPWSKMGACVAKPPKIEENGKLVGNFRSGKKTKRAEKQIPADRDSTVDKNNTRSSAEVPVKRKTLKELQIECPPGFRKFELEMKWQTIDEDIALQLWEDVYKPLYTFYECTKVKP